MNTTSESLLLRLRDASDHLAWSRFVRLYTPLIFYWARKTGMASADAADLVQDVLSVVFQKLPSFNYDRKGSFRGWMRTITMNRYRELGRKNKIRFVDATGSMMERVPDAVAESTWDLDYQQSLVAQAMQMIASEFSPTTWRGLQEFLLGKRPAAEIAEEMRISVWTIYSAKSRMMTRLREQISDLLD